MKDQGALSDGSFHLDDDEFDEEGRAVLAGTADRRELARIDQNAWCPSCS
jgi:hypothetical protein